MNCLLIQQLDAGGISPSFEEMKEALGLKSKSGIHRLISALEERGFLRRLPNRARALEVIKLPEGSKPAVGNDRDNVVPLRKPAPAMRPIAANDIVEVPLHGKIAAGVPIEAFEDYNLAVLAALLGAGEHYALEVSGTDGRSRIFDGDWAPIQKASTAREGDIVVAPVDGQDATSNFSAAKAR